ncbi:hypothetical protein GCM10027084_02880 [Pseudoxanthomonas sangjuensis]|uniref:hypothetical protein n=1 Tax=Pseudoxanthomonas sangjuensis TaxID=1503750 RepID=UPI001390871D|nr:hypothetical protein [Pseudoxanthomonas sangjuensis]
MSPVLREILMEPVGWLAIGGSLVMFALVVGIHLYVRKQIRRAERDLAAKQDAEKRA